MKFVSGGMTRYSSPAMHVDVRKMEDVVILDFEGRLVAGDGGDFAGDVFTQLIVDGFKKILVNLSEVEYIDSLGLGVLVEGFKAAKEAGGSLRLLKPRGRVENSLRLTMLLPLFQIYETEELAIADFEA